MWRIRPQLGAREVGAGSARRRRIADLPLLVVGATLVVAPLTSELVLYYMALVAAGMAILSQIAGGRLESPRVTEITITAFAGLAVLSTAWNPDADWDFARTVLWRAGGMAAVVVATVRSASDARRWRFLGLCYVCGAVAASLILIGGWATGAGIGIDQRTSMEGINANYSAYSIATALPILMALCRSAPMGRIVRVLASASYVLLAAGVVLTGSRGAVVAIAISFVIALWDAYRSRAVSAVLLLAAVAIAVHGLREELLEAIPPRLLVSGWADHRDFSTGRESMWSAAWSMFLEHPFLGVGAYAFPEMSGTGMQPHNVFLTVLAELGVVGGTFFAAAIVPLSVVAARRGRDADLGGAEWAAVLTWLIVSVTGVWLYTIPGWMAFAWLARSPRRQTATSA